MMLVEVIRHRLLLELDSYCDGRRSCRWVLLDGSLDFGDCRRSSFHVFREVFIVVIRIVVMKVETLHQIII